MSRLAASFPIPICLAWLLIGPEKLPGQSVAFDESVHRFLENYCLRCHGIEEEKGDRSFHDLSEIVDRKRKIDLGDPGKANALQDILDQLNLGEMPPKEKKVPQPTDQEIENTIDWITQTLLELENVNGPKQTVLRRLSRREYKNSMRDLLGLDNLPFDFTEKFPSDENDHGFVNIGDRLNLSDQHLDAYLEATDRYLRMAFRFDKPVDPKTEVIRAKDWGYPEKEENTPWMYRVYKPEKFLDFAAGKKQLSDHFDLGTFPHAWYRENQGIRIPGYYKITLTAEAIRRLSHPYDPKMIPTDLDAPMQLSLHISRGSQGLASDSINARAKIGHWDLEDHKPKEFEVVVWMDKRDVPFLNWDNGPGPSDYWMRDICKKYHTDIEFRGKEGSHAWHVVGKDLVPGRLVSDVWQGPLIRLHDFRIHGPLSHTFSTKAQKRFLDGKTDLAQVDLALAFSRFGQWAFRRPVGKKEIEPYLQMERNARLQMGRNRQEAFFIALKAMLVSPDFLYFREDKSDADQLSSFAIANRLSQFLWSSLPDVELFKVAEDKSIHDRAILKRQVERMLTDERSQAFVEGFSQSWLRLEKLGSMPPASLKFREYYRYGLEEAMLRETHHFVSHAIGRNAPISDFIESDYGFLNEDLARHYGIKGIQGIHLRKVSFPDKSVRGGLLGQASILTLTANGVDTSPVTRGIWVLESLLGTPPAPPPPDVEPISPDVRGAKTMKELLEKHRSAQACADCHAKIDPYGFPLEYFDPVGGYRPTYYRSRFWKNSTQSTEFIPGKSIDGTATLNSGERLYGPRSLKKALLTQMDLIALNLTQKLLTYGTGRQPTIRDQNEAKRIAETMLSGDFGFRDLILKVATSQAFSRK